MSNKSTIGPFYSFFGCHLENVIIEQNVKIGSFAWIQTVPVNKSKPQLIIRQGTHIGRQVLISAAQKIIIGQNCLISFGVSLLDHHHQFENPRLSPLFQGIAKAAETIIGEDCFIGAHSFIMEGVKLGKHCVVGANSLVTRSFPGYCVVAGNPAKIIRRLKYDKG